MILLFVAPRSLAHAVDRALRECDMKQATLAALMGISEPQLARQLTGHLSLARLLQLRDDEDGRAFLRIFWPLMAAEMGLDVPALLLQAQAFAARFATLIDKVQIRMLDASLPDEEAERRRA